MKLIAYARHWMTDWLDLTRSTIRTWREEPAPIVDVRERRSALVDAEQALRADAASKVLRVSQQPVAQGKQGRLVKFVRSGSMTLGYPDYRVLSVRGEFDLGRLEFRNQWRAYAYYGPKYDGAETPMNMEMIAEIYAMLRELRA